MGTANNNSGSAQFTPLFSTEELHRVNAPPQEQAMVNDGESVDPTEKDDFFLSGIDGLKRTAYNAGFADGEKKPWHT